MQENVKLAPYTTFRIGGEARYFVTVSNLEDLKSAVIFAREKELPILPLGGGSNLLISDDGFNGVVIKIEIGGIDFKKKNNKVLVSVGAGLIWDDFISDLVSKEISGLENLSFIPGSVGASPVQNIGAYGVEVSNFIQAVEVFNTKTLTNEVLTNAECDFSYRESIFKKIDGRDLIVVKVFFDLFDVFKPNLSYKELNDYLLSNDNLSPSVLRNAVIAIRKNKLPSIIDVGSAGSFFKNPIISSNSLSYLLDNYPKLPNWDCGEGNFKVSAAYLIDKICDAKKFSVGDVKVWQKQALVLVNENNASFNDVNLLAEKIEKSVKEKTGIILEREVQIIF